MPIKFVNSKTKGLKKVYNFLAYIVLRPNDTPG